MFFDNYSIHILGNAYDNHGCHLYSMAEIRDLPSWKEFESIKITNPTKQDFSVRYNGELYELHAGVTDSYPRAVAFHMAKHLTTRMLEPEAQKLREEFKESVYIPQESTLMNHDNPSRRIALYDVLGNRGEVDKFFIAIPLKSFVGDMSIYDKHVEKKTAKLEAAPSTPSKGKEDKKTE